MTPEGALISFRLIWRISHLSGSRRVSDVTNYVTHIIFKPSDNIMVLDWHVNLTKNIYSRWKVSVQSIWFIDHWTLGSGFEDVRVLGQWQLRVAYFFMPRCIHSSSMPMPTFNTQSFCALVSMKILCIIIILVSWPVLFFLSYFLHFCSALVLNILNASLFILLVASGVVTFATPALFVGM